MRTIVIVSLLAGCSFTVNGDRVWGQNRVDRFVVSFAEERCRIEAGCAEADVDICVARQRAFFGDTTRCRFRNGLAQSCLAELGDRTCDDGPSQRMPDVCFDVLQRCDVFFFDSGDFEGRDGTVETGR